MWPLPFSGCQRLLSSIFLRNSATLVVRIERTRDYGLPTKRTFWIFFSQLGGQLLIFRIIFCRNQRLFMVLLEPLRSNRVEPMGNGKGTHEACNPEPAQHSVSNPSIQRQKRQHRDLKKGHVPLL